MRPALVTSLALSALWAVPAAAQCPVAADLDTGIVMSDGDGTETFVRDSSLSVFSTYRSEGNPDNRSLLAHGIYVLENTDMEDDTPVSGTRVVYGYPMTTPDMPLPVPGGSWTTSVTRLGDGTLATERELYTYGQQTQITIGACTYEAIPITARFPDEGDGRYDILHYLPALGFAYLAESHGATFGDTYIYESIKAVE